MQLLFAAALLWSAALGAHGVNGVSLIYGQGDHVDVFAAEARSADWRHRDFGDRRRFSVYGIGSVAYWRAREHTENKELWDFGIAPVWRLQEPRASGVVRYLEASLGAHLLSRRRINGNRELSTAFQFGEFVGAGVLFGAHQQLGAGLRLQHVSNAGIKNPNPGLTYVALSLSYRF